MTSWPDARADEPLDAAGARLEVEFATAAWVTRWNHDRLHTSIGTSPDEHENEHYAALNHSPEPA